MLRITLAALHLIALGIGLGSVIARGSALREHLSPDVLRRVFRADTVWGIAAALWIITGLWRAIAGTEKSPMYYVSNDFFWAKMGMLLLVLALEIWPMLTLISWRKALARGAEPLQFGGSGAARRIALISDIEATLVALMVFAAVAMARGYGAR
jgi:putative membrane protein